MTTTRPSIHHPNSQEIVKGFYILRFLNFLVISTLKQTAKLNVDLKTMPGLKLLSLNKDDAVKNPPTEVEKLGIKIEVEAGEGEG